jgi:hypothetical protein
MIKATIFSFFLGVVFSQTVQEFAHHASSQLMVEVTSGLNLDAYEKIGAALSR